MDLFQVTVGQWTWHYQIINILKENIGISKMREKKEMGLSVCSEFSDISSHMMPAKIHGHQCPHILKQAPETMQKVIEWI